MPTFYHKVDHWTKATNAGGCMLIQNKIVGCPASTIDDAARHRVRVAKEYGRALVAISTHSRPQIDITNLSDAQHDGLACVVCGRNDQVMVPIPIASKYGSQLFRCSACDHAEQIASK